MAPTRSGTSVRNKPRGTLHPGMAEGKEGPPSRTQTSNLGHYLGCCNDFDVSLFERLILSGFDSAMLQVQHRMRPCIADIIRHQTYPTLKDHPSVSNYPSTLGVPHNLLFLDHTHPFGR